MIFLIVIKTKKPKKPTPPVTYRYRYGAFKKPGPAESIARHVLLYLQQGLRAEQFSLVIRLHRVI